MSQTSEMSAGAPVTAGAPHSPKGRKETGEPTTIDLYEKWRKIYPLWVSGGFQTWRRIVLVILILIYYVAPWLRWNGEPGVRFDLESRRFTVLWATFVPDEFVLLAWLLLIAALVLFTVTIAAGRIFCGWACPQTIWSLVYFSIERFVEGDRSARMRLDRGRWNGNRLVKKAIKFSLWTLVALSISITFVGYFQPIGELLPRLLRFELTRWETFFVIAPALGSFFVSGVLREQVCFHMCPYARFQSVMLDRDSLVISYDRDRGEPRGSRSRKADPAALSLGSCIDCKKCVNVCPTGIDIRDGLQYQCIGCAACIDACADVMQTMGYGETLVRYSSENRDEGRPVRRLRPRLVGYSSLVVGLLVLFSYSVVQRVPVDLDILRDRNRLYRESWDGSIENVYTLRITNRADAAREFDISVATDLPVEQLGPKRIEVPGGELVSIPVTLRIPGEKRVVEIDPGVVFRVSERRDASISASERTSFHGLDRGASKGDG